MKDYRSHIHFTRRSMLGALSALTFTPFIPATLEAQALPRRKRLLLFFSPNGVIMDQWRPPGGTAAGVPLATMSDALVSLDAWKTKINVMTGLSTNSIGTDNHQQGNAGLWTGSQVVPTTETSKPAPENNALPDGISIDQAIAKVVGSLTARPSLELGVGPVTSGGLGPGWMNVSYAEPFDSLGRASIKPPDTDPKSVFDRVFAGYSGTDTQTLAQIRAERKSVLDLVTSQVQGLGQSLGAGDRVKLEAHLSGVRDLERALEATTVTASCDPSALQQRAATRPQPTSSANFPTIVRLQTELAVLALKCDITRVITLRVSNSVGGQVHNWVEPSGQAPANTRGFRDHHEHSHDWELPVSRDHLHKIDRWYAEQFAYLLGIMNAIAEDGATLLDNSLIVWGNEIARGAHQLDDVPFIVAGNAGGFIKTGLNLDYGGRPNVPGPRKAGPQHNRLLVTIGQAMGLPLETFGTLDKGTGPLSEIVA
jgi:hypothetical protein